MGTTRRTSATLSASGAICASACRLAGIYVNSTSGGTIVLKDGGSSGTAITGTMTPAAGWNFLPLDFVQSAYATLAGTINATFLLE